MQHDRAQSILMSFTHTHTHEHEDTYNCCDLLRECDCDLISYCSLSCRVSLLFLLQSFAISLIVNLLFLLVFIIQIPALVIKADDLVFVCQTH